LPGARAIVSTVTDVEIPVRGGAMRAALALPGTTPAAGVVVLHEAFGLNDDIRGIAARFADEGYVALAPDLYAPGIKALCIAQAMLALARRRGAALDRAASARDWLAARRGRRPDRRRRVLHGWRVRAPARIGRRPSSDLGQLRRRTQAG